MDGVLSLREWTWCSLFVLHPRYLTSWIPKSKWEILVPQDENRINYSKLTVLDHLMYTESSNSCMQFSHLFWLTLYACYNFEQWLVWWLCCVHVWSFIVLVVGILLFSPSTSLQSSFPSFWLVSFHLIFNILCAKSHGMSLQLGQSVTWQFISRTARSSDETRDEEKLSANDLCPTPSLSSYVVSQLYVVLSTCLLQSGTLYRDKPWLSLVQFSCHRACKVWC